jgi:hypothetical protein
MQKLLSENTEDNLIVKTKIGNYLKMIQVVVGKKQKAAA